MAVVASNSNISSETHLIMPQHDKKAMLSPLFPHVHVIDLWLCNSGEGHFHLPARKYCASPPPGEVAWHAYPNENGAATLMQRLGSAVRTARLHRNRKCEMKCAYRKKRQNIRMHAIILTIFQFSVAPKSKRGSGGLLWKLF